VLFRSVVREVSLQEPADLRIRRRKDPQDNYPAVGLFLDEVEGMVDQLEQNESLLNSFSNEFCQYAALRDSRSAIELEGALTLTENNLSRIDAAITSPPYASALPYIDTNRLSLLVLGLISSGDIKETERSLIGHREIKKSTRRTLDASLIANEADLPEYVSDFLKEMLDTVKTSDVGFRRRNTPALLYQYFSDMKRNFEAIGDVLDPGRPYALVVGVNKTSPDGENEVVIPTPDFLADIGTECGFKTRFIEELDTYQRYGIHHSNSITDEKLIVLEKE